MNEKAEQLQSALSNFLKNKIVEAKLGGVIIDAGIETLKEKEGVNRLASFIFDDSSIRDIRNMFAEKIDGMIASKAPKIIETELEKAKTDILQIQISDLYEKYKDKTDDIVDYIVNLYKNLLESNLEKLLAAVNIQQIVIEKINSFDAVELENMIFGIMKRELKAIVYLGAMLGFLMGFINLLF